MLAHIVAGSPELFLIIGQYAGSYIFLIIQAVGVLVCQRFCTGLPEPTLQNLRAARIRACLRIHDAQTYFSIRCSRML